MVSVHDTRDVPRPEVIALFGPTAVGKTAVALALAARLRERGEQPVAVSADALQVYAGLETLTGAPTTSEQQELEHRLISLVGVQETFSAGRYARLAHAEIDGLLAAGCRPIVLGGTGLYLRAALSELSLKPPPLPGVRERWTAELEQQGPEALHALLSRQAPVVAARIEPGDRQRVVRALELLEAGELTGPADESELWTKAVRHPTLLIGLVMERPALYDRIDRRVEEMVAGGAEDEVRRAAAAGPSVTAGKALGFAELLRGDVAGMQRRTRQYARRQLTWMRKLSGVNLLDVTGRDPADLAGEVLELWLREAE
jgi:tRNA dimethylallyltransferase